MNPKLSVILPVYNMEKYLKKCLNSILLGSFKDFELIIINDGSTDNSEKIILEFMKKYKEKIIYIKKENEGLSETRNCGLKHAKGEYISFIDSDDFIEKDMYETMVKKLEEFPFDIVVCDVNLVYEDSKRINTITSGYTHDIKDKETIKKTMPYFYPTVWNKIYKKEIIQNISFLKNVWYEDLEFMLKLYPSINSIGVVKKPLYNYLQRKNSITYTYNNKLYDIINNMESVLAFYKQNGKYEEYKSELEYLYVRYAFATFPKRLAKCKSKTEYKIGIDYAFSKVNEYFPEYKKNKYLRKISAKSLYIKNFSKFISNINYYIQNMKKYN